MSRRASLFSIFGALLALLVALHLPYLSLPFHWDEMGQFVPAALDLYRDGAWVPQSTLPNVHPPALMAYLAVVWRIAGFSIPAARLAMLLIASAGVYVSFLLAIRLGRESIGAPAIASTLFLIVSPVFYTQSMLVLLDMPAMTLTVLALYLFLRERYGWCAVASTVLVLTKETAITTPLVFAAWLWFAEGRRRTALYFAAPMLAMAAWLAVLYRGTGHFLGNDEFVAFNVRQAIAPLHIVSAILHHLWTLFGADGKFLGSVALYAGWKALRGRSWNVALWVAGAQVAVVTLFGGALLDRYLLPVLPIVLIGMAVAASAYTAHWRWASHFMMVVLLVCGWFWYPPYPFPLENNLSMVDFVRLQKSAAGYLERNAAGKRIASVWPFTDAIRRPEFGYVQRALTPVPLRGLGPSGLAGANPRDYDLLVVYSRSWAVERSVGGMPFVRALLRRYLYYEPEAMSGEIREISGLAPIARWELGTQWIVVYGPPE